MDCTHSDSGLESQVKTVPSTTAEEIQGITSNPENFLFRGHRKCIQTQSISVWYGNDSNQDCKALQRVMRLAEHISGSALPSLQDIYLKRCKSRAAKIIKDSNHPGNHLFILLPSGKRFRSMMAKTERLRSVTESTEGERSENPSAVYLQGDPNKDRLDLTQT